VEISIIYYLLIAAAIWLALLSFYLYKVTSHYKKLAGFGKNLNLAQTLEKIIDEQREGSARIARIVERINQQEIVSSGHFQKYSLMRYNPFEDTGGDQSFIIVLLDGKNSGVVISSLHSRNGTRVYAKAINQGQPVANQFSKEEKEVIEKAINNKPNNLNT